MLKASAAIKKALKEKDQGIISGEKAIRTIMKGLHGQVMDELGKAALDSWDAFHLRQVLDAIEYQMANYAGTAQTTLSGLLDNSWALGVGLADAPLAVAGVYTGYHLSTSVLDTMKGYSSDYLQGLFQDGWYKIKGEITLGVLAGKTPREVAEAIGKTMDSGKFENITARAETIARHEMRTVFSQAAQLRMETAAEYVDGLEKQWIHAGHPFKARPAHLAANGNHVPVSERFNIGGVLMKYPHDPGAPIGETINCGCDHVPYHEDWQ